VFVARALERLFPVACLGCDAPGVALCPRCLPPAHAALRFRVGQLPVVALGSYDGSLRRAVLALKRGRRDVATVLAEALAERFEGELDGGPLLVPVPTTARRSGERGFDQGLLLARGIGRRAGVEVVCALRKRAGLGPQHGRSRAQRLAAEGRFVCSAPEVLIGVRILLVDDVATTGGTLKDCEATLERAGACVVGAIVAAHAERELRRGSVPPVA
jgi:predicted amidophosphoribosyltransferase